jgi:hypothetical protein
MHKCQNLEYQMSGFAQNSTPKSQNRVPLQKGAFHFPLGLLLLAKILVKKNH